MLYPLWDSAALPVIALPCGSRLAAQIGWARVDHQVCLAHLIRDVQYAINAGDAAFAPGVMGLLKRAVGIGRRRQTLADSTLVLPGFRKGSIPCSRSRL